jgi:hypothetical protein
VTIEDHVRDQDAAAKAALHGLVITLNVEHAPAREPPLSKLVTMSRLLSTLRVAQITPVEAWGSEGRSPSLVS